MPGGRPTKPLALVQGHRTKAEKAARAEAESKLLTGVSIKEWPEVKENQLAHERFKRVKKLLKKIDKDDALFEPVINRYCLLLSECNEFEQMKEQIKLDLEQLEKKLKSRKIDYIAYIETKTKLQKFFMDCDKKVMEKRKAILDIEKENALTIQSALRSIPKKPKEKAPSKMAALLEKRQVK